MVIVIEVIEASLAEKAGLKVGDRIKSINGIVPDSADHAVKLIQDSGIRSAPLILKYWRKEKQLSIAIDFKNGEDKLGVLLVEPIKMDRIFKGLAEKGKRIISRLTEELPSASDNLFVSIPKMNIFLVLFLYAVTFTLYEPIWYLRRRNSINSLNTKVKLNVLFPVLLLVLILVQNLYCVVNFNLGAKLFWILPWCFSIIIAFRVKKMLGNHLKSRVTISADISIFLTFFFRFLYLQYKINRQSGKVLC
ncbi:PDZ domain-containing protein [Candidatus Omnitrophota bacterium]